MELRHLRYFVAVVEEQSFTRAAEKLFIAQPPLSRQIQNLEELLGVRLFERGSRPLKTTPAGQFFYQHALKLLANAEEIQTMTKRVAQEQQQLNIGFVGSLLLGLLPQIIYLYRQQHPNLKINLIGMGTVQQNEALKTGEIDVGFGRLYFSDPKVKRLLLREERLSLAVHSQHPLAYRQAGIYLSEIVHEHLFLYPNSNTPNFSKQILSIFSDLGLEPKQITLLEEVQIAVGLVAAGAGMCIVPNSVSTLNFPNICYLNILDPIAYSPVYMSYRNLDENPAILSLLDTVKQIYLEQNIENKLGLYPIK